jgi:8-oxo-dGTP diphosphatase
MVYVNIVSRYTLCFLICDDEVLMLFRSKPPNQDLWNGVGGHIETGETPFNSCIREVAEETGISINNPRFNGLLTWEGFEIPSGGLYLFSVLTTTKKIIPCDEGILAWKPLI